jgi:DNA-binding LacI/PurR family transcriptional regulator
MKVTINDIAQVAGVSKATISKVINDSPSIPLSTKERIRGIIAEMNYIPNAHATLLAKRTTNTISYILCGDNESVFKDPFVFSIIGGCNKFFYDHNYELNLSSLAKNIDTESFVRKYIYSGLYSGVVLSSELCSPELLIKLNELNFPYVIIGYYPSEIPADVVEIDNKTGGEIATNYLVRKGLKKIYYIGAQTSLPFAINRINGYKKAISESNLEENIILINERYSKISSDVLFSKYIPADFDADGIVCSDNFISTIIMKYLNEKNIHIPNDIKLITFDNTMIAQYSIPSLSTVDIDTYKLGFTAAEVLFNKITTKNSEKKSIFIKPSIIERESSL